MVASSFQEDMMTEVFSKDCSVLAIFIMPGMSLGKEVFLTFFVLVGATVVVRWVVSFS
jgi:hypothetical protein